MSKEEVADLFQSAHEIGKVIEREYQSSALTLVVQDGKDAGQTVEHVHLHIIPRKAKDWSNNDDIYEDITKNGVTMNQAYLHRTTGLNNVKKPIRRKGVDGEWQEERSLQEMAQEAARLRIFFKHISQPIPSGK